MKNVLTFVLGGIFAAGLLLSGMFNPKKVIDFLDISGSWDPSLGFVMLGAIAVALIPFQKVIHSPDPRTLFGEPVQLPRLKTIDSRLLLGSILFGAGWGLSGLCPAPSFTLLGLGQYQIVYFIGAMFLGVFVHRQWAGESA